MHEHGALFLYLAKRAQQKRIASPGAGIEARRRPGRRVLFAIGGPAALKQADPCW
jgi:hypothetical protein